MTNGQNEPGMTAGVLRAFLVVAVVAFVLAIALTISAAFDSDTSTFGVIMQVVMSVLVGVVTVSVLRTWHRQRKIENAREDPPTTDPDGST